MSYLAVERSNDGSYACWNITQYQAYMREKHKEKKREYLYPPIDHYVLNKRFAYNNEYAIFTKVVKHWHAGYYLTGIYEINGSGSHGTVVIENINCIASIILESLEIFNSEFKLLKEI